MYNLTQGTIISGIRSKKYPGIVCNGIVVSARCDLANCKIHNVYYLIAIPVGEWILSDDGFLTVISGRIHEIENKLETRLQEQLLDWETMKNFTSEEFAKVIHEQCANVKEKDRNDWIATFDTYTKYTTVGLPTDVKKGIISQEQKRINSYLLSIANGQTTHYAYIPEDAYLANKCVDNGLIVDLQELDRVDAQTIDVICAYEMDSESHFLTDAQIEAYNNQFFLHDGPGYAVPDHDIKSPWIEYLMQRFSNSFIRIGVDGPQKTDIEIMTNRIFDGGEQ